MFTHPVALRDWLCDGVQVDPRRGGRLFLWWNSGARASGEITAVEPGKKLAFGWHHNREPEPSKIQVTLAGKSGGTLVTLSHMVGSGAKWRAVIPTAQAAWEGALENLQSVVETGIDLRYARLPRLGVFIDDFNAEVAARIGVPVKAGVRLAGVADGTGAQAAGLHKDDVIVKLGGKKVTGFTSLGDALQGHRSGEYVPVVFYRGAEKMTIPMELSKRPLPEIPPLPELVERVRRNAAEISAAFAQLVEGVSESEAAHRPAPGAWSLKDSMAHFILTERDTQSWFAQMINDRDIGEDLEFRPNVDARVFAVHAAYPTVPALLDELKRSQQETIAMLANVPETFVARKHLYARVCSWTLGVLPGHYRDEHLELMQAAIQSARQGSTS